MIVRPILAAAAVAACAAVSPGFAVTRPAAPGPEVTDGKGDANGVNRQGVLTQGPDGQVTDPASYAPADILSIDWASTFTTTTRTVRGKKIAVRTPSGFTVTLNLAGAPASGIVYRIESASPFCAGFWLEYRVAPDGSKRTGLRCTDPASTWPIPDAVVTGNSITWTVPMGVVKPLKANQQITALGAQTRGFVWFAGQTVDVPLLGPTSGLTVPQLDHAFVEEAIFKVGS